jgi:hypothetical protein
MGENDLFFGMWSIVERRHSPRISGSKSTAKSGSKFSPILVQTLKIVRERSVKTHSYQEF